MVPKAAECRGLESEEVVLDTLKELPLPMMSP